MGWLHGGYCNNKGMLPTAGHKMCIRHANGYNS